MTILSEETFSIRLREEVVELIKVIYLPFLKLPQDIGSLFHLLVNLAPVDGQYSSFGSDKLLQQIAVLEGNKFMLISSRVPAEGLYNREYVCVRVIGDNLTYADDSASLFAIG